MWSLWLQYYVRKATLLTILRSSIDTVKAFKPFLLALSFALPTINSPINSVIFIYMYNIHKVTQCQLDLQNNLALLLYIVQIVWV